MPPWRGRRGKGVKAGYIPDQQLPTLPRDHGDAIRAFSIQTVYIGQTALGGMVLSPRQLQLPCAQCGDSHSIDSRVHAYMCMARLTVHLSSTIMVGVRPAQWDIRSLLIGWLINLPPPCLCLILALSRDHRTFLSCWTVAQGGTQVDTHHYSDGVVIHIYWPRVL